MGQEVIRQSEFPGSGVWTTHHSTRRRHFKTTFPFYPCNTDRRVVQCNETCAHHVHSGRATQYLQHPTTLQAVIW